VEPAAPQQYGPTEDLDRRGDHHGGQAAASRRPDSPRSGGCRRAAHLSTDCGFGREDWRAIAFYKCVAINLGANIVRRELKLPEVPIPAADPRWTFAG
jgi:hypothetical protein